MGSECAGGQSSALSLLPVTQLFKGFGHCHLADGCARLPWICTTGFLRHGPEVLARSGTELEHGDSQGLGAVGLQWSLGQLEKDHGQASCCPGDSESLWACPGHTGVSQGGGGLRQGGPFPSATATLLRADHKGLPAEGVEKGSQNPPVSDSVVLAVSGPWLFERDTLTGFLLRDLDAQQSLWPPAHPWSLQALTLEGCCPAAA